YVPCFQAFLDGRLPTACALFPGLSRWSFWCYQQTSLPTTTASFLPRCGVQQGTPLGPLYFCCGIRSWWSTLLQAWHGRRRRRGEPGPPSRGVALPEGGGTLRVSFSTRPSANGCGSTA